MKSQTIINVTKEIRSKPKKLAQKDIRLFEHEFSTTLPKVIGMELRNVSVLRDVIFSLSKLTFYKSLTHIFKPTTKYFLNRLRLLLTSSNKIKFGIWIVDEISAEYFHWFTDALTRLKAIESNENVEILKQQFYIILPDFYQQKQYIVHSIHMMGYNALFYDTKKRLQIGTLLSCSHTAPTGNYNTELINSINKCFTPKCLSAPSRMIYISRSKAIKRKVSNEDEVIQILLLFKVEIHIFENYSFAEQLKIMSATKSLISIHGAGLTNMLFMKKGGQILELRNEGDNQNNCYFSLSSSMDHDYYYLNCHGDKEDTNSVNITVDLLALKTLMGQIIDN
jgi:hypothetical protein